MESLPEKIVQKILSLVIDAKDVAACTSVSKTWKNCVPYLRSLLFSEHIFDKLTNGDTSHSDSIVLRMVSSVLKLEELRVYCPFSGTGLASWLTVAGTSLKKLDLSLESTTKHDINTEISSKLDCITAASNLESLILREVLMVYSPKWDVFHRLRNLEIIVGRFKDRALRDALGACPNLTHLRIVASEGLTYISIDNPNLIKCTLQFHRCFNFRVIVNCSKIEFLEVRGCVSIRVYKTQCLKSISIGNYEGHVRVAKFNTLVALESLSIVGMQWSWDALSTLLQMASEVKHLYMRVQFTGEPGIHVPFPEIDVADFFNSHPKLQTFGIHGAMFAAICQKNSLKNVDLTFQIPCLEEVVVTVRSPLNAEQKMSTLESLVKYAKNLKKMTIKLGVKNNCDNISADDFVADVYRFRCMNSNIVSIW